MHFANSEPPNNPLPGQIWWDTSLSVLKLNTAATLADTASWKLIPTMFNEATVGAITGTPVTGDFWYDSGLKQLRVYTGDTTDGIDGWLLVGPLSTSTGSKTGAIPDTIIDTIGYFFYENLKYYCYCHRDGISTHDFKRHE